MKFKIEYIIILVLIVVILWMRACKERPISQEPIITTTTITNYDTLFSTTPVYVPKYIKRIIHDTTFKNIDTNEILKDYFSTYYYEDKINNDSVKIYINDSVSKNRIVSRLVKYDVVFRTNIITNTIIQKPKQKREFYYGFGLGGTQQGFNYIGAEFMFKLKKPQLLGVGIGINNNLVPVANIKMLWKIGK